MKQTVFLIAVLSLMQFSLCRLSIAQPGNESSTAPTENKRTFPFLSGWAEKKGIDLPSPFGVTGFYTFMSRDIEITDVTVEFGGSDPQSINDFASFAVRNKTSIYASKFDVWILPFINTYFLVGYASTNSKLDATFTIDRPLLPPEDIVIQTLTPVKGPYAGLGTTIVAGYKNWFVLGDASYGKTLPDKLDNSISFTMFSFRSGLSGKLGEQNLLRAWIGTIYMNSKSTLEIKEPSDVLGEVLVKIDQQPVNPWTLQCGFMVTLSKKIEIMTESGTNFEDAAISVLTVSYRF
jgi:hypothetical protein